MDESPDAPDVDESPDPSHARRRLAAAAIKRFGWYLRDAVKALVPLGTSTRVRARAHSDMKKTAQNCTELLDAKPELIETLLEEARREYDRNLEALDRIRLRAQFAFTTAIALVAVMLARLPSLSHHGHGSDDVLFGISLGLLCLGLLGTLTPLTGVVTITYLNLSSLDSNDRPASLAGHLIGAAECDNARIRRYISNLRIAMRILLYGAVVGGYVLGHLLITGSGAMH